MNFPNYQFDIHWIEDFSFGVSVEKLKTETLFRVSMKKKKR